MISEGRHTAASAMGECSRALRVSPLLTDIASFDEGLAKRAILEAGPDADHDQLTVKCLELLSIYMCKYPNERRYDHPLLERFMYPDFTWTTEGQVAARSAREFLDRMREAAEVNPNYEIEPLNACGSLDKGGASGAVWTLIRTHGPVNVLEDGQTRDIIGRFKWEKQNGRWQWCSLIAMRGSSELGWEFD